MFRIRPTLLALLLATGTALAVTACGSDKEAAISCLPSDCATTDSAPTPAVVANPIYPGADWEISSPEAEGMSAAPLENIDPYCVEHGCRAVVVIRHGKIVWERYWGGWTEASTDNSWSMAKSVTSALVGIAIHDGKIKGLDEKATDFVPEWLGSQREKITIGNLLSMESGLTWTMTYNPPSGDTARMIGSDDQVAYALNRQVYREPGHRLVLLRRRRRDVFARHQGGDGHGGRPVREGEAVRAHRHEERELDDGQSRADDDLLLHQRDGAGFRAVRLPFPAQRQVGRPAGGAG